MSGTGEADRQEKGYAWITLATNDTYALGAIVVARSLSKVGTRYQKCVMITNGVSPSMRSTLQGVFESVILVDLLDSEDSFHLGLLARPELGVTFTKLHCWMQVQFEKCVFLDADTLVVENCDELFEREELSAAPDVGWPDCFNSGVFVFRPNTATFSSIAAFALQTKSFDGGDQGLLNLFFKDWSLEGPDKRLPFIYNMCSTASYTYLAAYNMYGAAAKIVHFIGPRKPWTFVVNHQTGQVVDLGELSHFTEYIQQWWNLCIETVFPLLAPDMEEEDETRIGRDNCTDEFERATTTTLRSETSVDPSTSFTVKPVPEFHHPFVDPWDAYIAANTTGLDPVDSQENGQKENHEHTLTNHCGYDEHLDEFSNTNNASTLDQNTCKDTDWDDSKPSDIVLVDKSSPISYPYKNCNLNSNSDTYQASISSSGVMESNKADSSSFKTFPKNIAENVLGPHTSNSHNTTVDVMPIQVANPHSAQTPSSQSYTEIPCCEQAVDTKVNAGDDSICLTNDDETNTGGLAGRLANIALSPAGSTLEEYLRRSAWESSNADYMHRDSFDNVWGKIQSTLEGGDSVPDVVQPEDPPSNAEEPAPEVLIAGDNLASGDSEKLAAGKTPEEEPKGAPLADAPSAAVATPPLPSALVDVDSSSASNLGSIAQTVSQAVAPSLSSLEPFLPPADSDPNALTVDQVVTGEPSVALDTLGAGLLSAEVAPSPILVESGLLEQSAETTEPAIPVPAPSDCDLPELLPETLATEQPPANILAASDPIQTESPVEPVETEQPAVPLPDPSISSPLELPAESHEIGSAVSAVLNEPSIVPVEGELAAASGIEREVQSVTSDPVLEPGSVPSEPLPPQPVPRTPTVIEATPPTSPPIGQSGAFPLAASAPVQALVGAALSKERAETAPASQSDAEAAPIPPKRRGGPGKGGKSAVQKGKK